MDEKGNFIEYVRKGRNNSIVAYDELSSAKRGLSHSRSMCGQRYRAKGTVAILQLSWNKVLEL